MDEELEKEHHRTYAYHFFFNNGLFEEIFHLRDFIKEIDDFLFEKLKKVEDRSLENTNPSFAPEVQFEFIFHRILWRTSFLNSYFLAESSLDQICKNIQKAEGYNLNLPYISGTGIMRASVYLQKVCSITNIFNSKNWNTLLYYNKLRNLLVHSDGIFKINNKNIMDIIKRVDGGLVDIIDDETLSLNITKKLTTTYLDVIESFFQQLHVEMNERLK